MLLGLQDGRRITIWLKWLVLLAVVITDSATMVEAVELTGRGFCCTYRKYSVSAKIDAGRT